MVKVERFKGTRTDIYCTGFYRRIMRPTDVPDTGLLCDLLWSDPDKDVQGWGENDRGVSFTFGADVVSKFLNRHDLDLICRAHQVREEVEFVMILKNLLRNTGITCKLHRFFACSILPIEGIHS